MELTMNLSVFDFRNYREYLKEALPTQGPSRGGRSKLAAALGCQNGFVSLVLSGEGNFSPEHAMTISRFLNHDEEERDYFLLLVQFERAGSKDLESHYKKKVDEIHARRKEIRERIQVKSTLSEADHLTYYSSWHYAAIHMSLYTPALQTRESLANYFHLPTAKVSQIVNFLTSIGLVEEKNHRLFPKPSRIHLSPDSPLIAKHHTNWRMKSIQSLDEPRPRDLHYSAILSLDEEAVEKIREILLLALQNSEPILKAAKDETVYVTTIDLFQLR
jgi:uncharacterized protein (TIGR02147 family)